jgi:hypothetical protein
MIRLSDETLLWREGFGLVSVSGEQCEVIKPAKGQALEFLSFLASDVSIFVFFGVVLNLKL